MCMATTFGTDKNSDTILFFVMVFIFCTIPLMIGIYNAHIEYFNEVGICTEKYVVNGTPMVTISTTTYEINPVLYKGVMIGKQYSIQGDHKVIKKMMIY